MNTDALMLEASSEILLLLDAQSLDIVAASRAAHEQLGYPYPQLVGMPIGDIECALSDLFFWEEMAASAGPIEAHGSLRRADGSVFDIRKFARYAGDKREYFVLRARPERGQARTTPETDLTGLHLAATLEATEDGILLADNEGAILNMNQRFSHLMALPEQLLAERDDHGIVAFIDSVLLNTPGTSDSPNALKQTIDLKLDLGGDTFETLYLTDGRVIECASHPARDRDRTIGRVFCYRDVTERVHHEHFLKEARDIAEQATLSKGQFLANMSHEIRTPMNAILGMLKLMHVTDLTERQYDYVNKAESAAQSLLGLLNDILDFSKIEAGKLELDLQPFAPERLLRELSVILAANLGNKPVELLYDIDPQMPRNLKADAMRLQQILINLGGNALKFTSQGEVVVQMKVLERSDYATRLHIGVRDSGIGIAPENQARIFSDFSQAESSTTRRFGGTGLGLSICKRLVALMGGELKLSSVLGQGSNFYFEITLPNAEADAVALPASLAALPPLPEGMQVLVVDDNEIARGLLVSMTQSLGWVVDTAVSGQDAIDKLMARAANAQPPYEAIFMDWEMPQMDGWESLARMRELGAAFGTPISVIVTAHNRGTLAKRNTQEQSNLNAFLVKPVTASMLQEVVVEARAGRNNFRRKARTRSRSAERLTGMRILVVEDNLVNQQVARELLSSEGAHVELADNGLLAISAVAQAHNSVPFDAVLMDVQMPVMDGFAATEAIRNGLGLGLDQLPIIAMTANAMASDREECLQAGMNDHVGKPFDLGYLVTVLLKVSGFKPLPPPATASTDATPAQPLAQGDVAPFPQDIDVAGALERLDGMKSLYVSLAQEFVTELRTVVPEYRRSLEASLLSESMRQMHTLKGTAATLGAMHLAELAQRLEKLCHNADRATEALAALGELDAAVQATMEGLMRVALSLEGQPD